jgi:hypothetical protein
MPTMSGSTASIAATVSATGLSSFAPPPQMLKLITVSVVSSSPDEHDAAAVPAASVAATSAATSSRLRIRPSLDRRTLRPP